MKRQYFGFARSFTRYVVLHTYEVRQGWKRFKAEAAEWGQYWWFRAKYSVSRSGGREDKGDFEPLPPEQHAVISKAEPGRRGKTVSSLLDPKNDHLFTAEAVRKAFVHLKSEPKMTQEKLAAIRAQADAYLRDALREENAEATRVDCAFDAVYMYCRCVMAGQDEGLQHPHEDVLRGAANKLGWDEGRVGQALAYVAYRDSLERLAQPQSEAQSESARETLVRIAEELKSEIAKNQSGGLI